MLVRLLVPLATVLLALAGCDPALTGLGDIGAPGDGVDAPGPVADEEAEILAQGLAAFRAPGAVLGAACANCHAPDALDLAYFDFSDADIRRRGAEHLPPAEVDKIVAFVRAQRRRYGIAPRDPRTHRPLQPGGHVLPGETPQQRDLAFARSLRAFAFAGAPVLTRADALAARDEWLALDLRALPIGLPFNRWSEDPHHGDATLADWLPDLPRPALDREALFSAHDAYLANPTDQALLDLLDRTGDLTTEAHPGDGGRLMNLKYQSVLAAQHLFRSEVTAGDAWGDRPSSAFFPLAMTTDKGPNPVWEIGTFAKEQKHGGFDLPAGVLARTSGDLRAEMTAMRVPWFWAGMLFDQGLQRTHGSNSVKFAEYLLHHIDVDYDEPAFGGGGYRVHAAFAVNKKLLHQFYDPDLPVSGDRLSVTFSNFASYDRAWKWAPTDPERLGHYTLLTENGFRMWLHLFQHEAEAGARALHTERLLRVIDQMEAFFEWAGSDHLETNRRLVADTRAAVGAAV